MRSRPVAALCVIVLLPIGTVPHRHHQRTSPTGTASVTVTVEATHAWIDSGLTVRKGERLSFQASGTIRWGAKPDQVAGPGGHAAKAGKLGVGGLIGRIGPTSGKAFAIGDTQTPIVMPKSGQLFLGINDFNVKDNAGSFVVTISQSGAL